MLDRDWEEMITKMEEQEDPLEAMVRAEKQ